MRTIPWMALCALLAAIGPAAAGPRATTEAVFLPKELKGTALSVPIQLPPHFLGGGDRFDVATPIDTLPFWDGDSTCAAADNYFPGCAYAGNSTGRDVVYVYHATTDQCVDISLCGSGFDTVLDVYENDPFTEIACNDDYCGLASQLTSVQFLAGNDYYIVIDGWGATCGTYLLAVSAATPTLRGTVFYYAPTPLPNANRLDSVQVCLTPPTPAACGISGSSGIYKVGGGISGTTTLEATRSTSPLDAGAVGGGDVNLLVSWLAGAVSLTPDEQIAGDVNRSTPPANSLDLWLLRRYLVFDLTACPDCGTWKFFGDPLGSSQPSPFSTTLPVCGSARLDLKGIFLGDIDGSWPGRFKVAEPSALQLTFGAASWAGSELSLPVEAEPGEAPLTSLAFSLTYDAQALEYVDATLGQGAIHMALDLNLQRPGLLHGLLTQQSPSGAASSPFLNLQFRLRPGQAQASVSFTRVVANDHVSPELPEVLVSRDDQLEALPRRFQMSASPNPFNPRTRIAYTVPDGAGTVPVTLRVLDLAGHALRELVRGPLGPGTYGVTWDGTRSDGEVLASGVYLLQLRAGNLSSTKKVVLLK
jgi:hypothetical protein